MSLTSQGCWHAFELLLSSSTFFIAKQVRIANSHHGITIPARTQLHNAISFITCASCGGTILRALTYLLHLYIHATASAHF